jgi:hypothetical protein
MYLERAPHNSKCDGASMSVKVIWWIPVVAALAAPDALAQGGSASADRLFDPATVTTVEGQISEVQRIPRGRRHEGVHLLLSTGSETLDVHLGPDAYVDRQKMKVAKGDAIKVTGSRVTVDGKPAIIAQEVTKGDERLVLRDATGTPAWSRGGR